MRFEGRRRMRGVRREDYSAVDGRLRRSFGRLGGCDAARGLSGCGRLHPDRVGDGAPELALGFVWKKSGSE